MLFFAFCLVAVVDLFPRAWSLTLNLRILSGYCYWENVLIEWHRSELLKRDPWFRFEEENIEFLTACGKALSDRIEPLDARYPNPLDFRPSPVISMWRK